MIKRRRKGQVRLLFFNLKKIDSVKIMKIQEGNGVDYQLHSAYITGPNAGSGGMKGGMLVGVNPHLNVNTNAHVVKGRPQQGVMNGKAEQKGMGKYRDFMKKQKDNRR